MLVYRRKKQHYQMQAPLTPLIDIVFMLLVYFLLTTNFITESGIDVNLPESSSAAVQNREQITVYLDAAGVIYVGENAVPFNDLFDRLRARIRGSAQSLVMIKADKRVELETVVNIMDIARAAGAKRLFLATEKVGKRG